MKYTCLFSDMDGTLLDAFGRISAENRKAICEFVRQGGRFTFATGRSELIAKPFYQKLEVQLPAILYNGAAVYDFSRNVFLYKATLSNEIVREVYDIALSVYPDICVEAFAEGPIHLFNQKGMTDHLIAREHQPTVYRGYDPECEYMKLLLYGKKEKLEEVASAIAPLSNGNFVFVFSAPFYLEILPLHCSKGTAMAWILKKFHISAKEVAAIGDFENDLTMIEQAALGAAPENGTDSVKNAADIIVSDHDHSALADLIYHYIL